MFRSDDCVLNPEITSKIEKKLQRVEKMLLRMTDEIGFGEALSAIYHADGHLVIGENCKNKPDDFDNPMVYSEVSARDPVFYR